MIKSCHVCMTNIKSKKDELPSICPACGADLENISLETVRYSISCDHLKGSLGIGNGEMFITNLRLFWIPRKDSDSANPLVGIITGKNADKTRVNIPLSDLESVGDCKKLLRKGITVYTKTGESFNFFFVNRGNPQILKDMIEPCIVK